MLGRSASACNGRCEQPARALDAASGSSGIGQYDVAKRHAEGEQKTGAKGQQDRGVDKAREERQQIEQNED